MPSGLFSESKVCVFSFFRYATVSIEIFPRELILSIILWDSSIRVFRVIVSIVEVSLSQ
jgi:hypothetical protein